MSDTRLALNSGEPIDIEGFTVPPLKALTYDQQGRYSAWVERKAWEAIRRAKAVMSREEFESAQRGLTADIASQNYEYDGHHCQTALQSPTGFRYAIYLSLSAQDPAVSEDTVAAMAKKDLGALIRAWQGAHGVVPPMGTTAVTPGVPSDSDTSAPSSSTNHSV